MRAILRLDRDDEHLQLRNVVLEALRRGIRAAQNRVQICEEMGLTCAAFAADPEHSGTASSQRRQYAGNRAFRFLGYDVSCGSPFRFLDQRAETETAPPR